MANIALVKEQLITFTFALSLIMEPVEAFERPCYESRSAHVNIKGRLLGISFANYLLIKR